MLIGDEPVDKSTKEIYKTAAVQFQTLQPVKGLLSDLKSPETSAVSSDVLSTGLNGE